MSKDWEAERSTLRSNYETAQMNWDLTLTRAEAAEAEVSRLRGRVGDLRKVISKLLDVIGAALSR